MINQSPARYHLIQIRLARSLYLTDRVIVVLERQQDILEEFMSPKPIIKLQQ